MEPAILSLVAHAHDNFRLLLIGDHRQLGPVVNCKKLWDQLGVSLFERLFRRPGQISLTLPIQYRMQPAICQWPSKDFYGNELVCAPDMKVRALPRGMEWAKGERLPFCTCSWL